MPKFINSKHFGGFKRKPPYKVNMRAKGYSEEAGLQAFLDHLSQCDLSVSQQDWFQIDIAAMFGDTPIHFHELNPLTGESLLFLNESLVLMCPQQSIIHHFPRQLIHCFVEDRRRHILMDDEPVFKAELFSISPLEEQLCWMVQGQSELEVPQIQAHVARWMAWLNRTNQ